MPRSLCNLLTCLVLVAWFATGAALSSRSHLVFDYSVLPSVPAAYEILAAPYPALLALGLSALLLGRILWVGRASLPPPGWRSLACMAVACLPLGLVGLRVLHLEAWSPSWWEPLHFAMWSGLGMRMRWAPFRPVANGPRIFSPFLLALAIALAGSWWFAQSCDYHARFLLGFNDVGHFAQRISSTAQGEGFLLESPVLPPFWDHFNPGLVGLVPLWWCVPDVRLFFLLQSACLSGSAWLVAGIARQLGYDWEHAAAWGGLWLFLPVVGQMNLAYTYGWHPITLAIPCLLWSLRALLQSRYRTAALAAGLGASFEEGVLVATACFSVAMGLRARWGIDRAVRQANGPPGDEATEVPWSLWLSVAGVAGVLFAAIYVWSGLSEFQTGRFSRLGAGPLEILLSPLLRPGEFWGLFARPRNLAFVALWLGPVALAWTRASVWYLLALTPPLGVLMVWEHLPAQSIAFQYTSSLLPVLLLSAMAMACTTKAGISLEEPLGNDRSTQAQRTDGRAWAGLLCAGLLSVYVGQFPWSGESLLDVKAKTYGLKSDAARLPSAPEGNRLGRIVQSLREPPSGFRSLRILATGRVAAHFVGAREVETVGQFWQRFDALARLDPSLASPVLRYDAIVLDAGEAFQQTQDETRRVLEEALQQGFRMRESGDGIAWLER